MLWCAVLVGASDIELDPSEREREATNELVRDRIILHMQHILPPSASFDPLSSHSISGVATLSLSLFLAFSL